MAESTLSIAYADLRSQIGYYLGYTRDDSNWSTAQTNVISDVLKSGLRRFYNPPLLPGMSSAHEWTFLKPTTSITVGTSSATVSGTPSHAGGTSTIDTTASVFESQMVGDTVTFDTSETEYTITAVTDGDTVEVSGDASGEASGDGITFDAQLDYDLPDNFGGIIGGLTFNDANVGSWQIEVISEVQIREIRERLDDSNGSPHYASIRPRYSATNTTGQRFLLLLEKQPDSEYTLDYKYNVLPNVINSSYPYPLGGMQHGECILQSCLSVAEERVNDVKGVRYQSFMQELASSIGRDRKLNTPEYLGYNGDGSQKSIFTPGSREKHTGVWDVNYNGMV